MITCAAFLRGINSGLNPTTKMNVLKTAFEEMGFRHVRTVIASGNVLVDTKTTNEATLEKTMEKALPKAIGFESATMVLTYKDLQRLADLNPFKRIAVTPETRLFVTFVKERPKSS